ncbi:MAG: hypothetical protein NZ873_01420, partial [Crenarchaeota archaeon]|nr:hypothetical protein [Thermoproteota archaeon]
MDGMKLYALIWLSMILTGVVIIMFISLQKKPEKIMELTISGGFWSAYETYEYYSNGTVSSKERNSLILIPSFVLDELTSRTNLLLKAYPNGLKLEPEEGAADYFIYKLTVYNRGKAINYYWTDASEKPPKELVYLHHLLREISGFSSNTQDI